MVICGAVVFTASVSAGLIFWRFDTQLVSAKLDDLERETEIQATRFVNQINELTRDVRVVSGTAPVQGIIRAIANQGVDPLDGSTLQDWEHRLAVNFRESLKHKPSYLQMRFIGVADGGRELVRVDRNGPNASIRIVPDGQLQPKARTGYFRRAINREAGSVYISPINLNREQGKIQTPRTPVIRAAIPVRAGSGEVFGVVVINYGLNDIFRSLSEVPNPQHRYYLANSMGAYLLHPSADYAFDFEFGEPRLATRDFPIIADILRGATKQASLAVEREAQVVSARRVDYGPPDLKRSLVVVVSDSYDDITAITGTVIQQIGLVIVLLLILGLLLGLWLARLITRPIVQVTQSVRDMDHDAASWQRPQGLTTEAHELAAALDSAFDRLQRRTVDLDKSNNELKQFAYIASHDLQEPVRTISSFAELLESQYADVLDAQGQKYMSFLVTSCERMRMLIHGLLEYSRLGESATSEQVDLNAVMAAIQQDMQATISASGSSIRVGQLPTMQLYAVEVRLLFQNLLSNAIKYVEAGRTPEVDISAQRQGNGWQFTVSDNGMGISPEHREKVFLIFQRLHGRSSPYAGTGIGLAHCRKVVNLHHGRIWVESAVGGSGGSKFCFTLNEVDVDE